MPRKDLVLEEIRRLHASLNDLKNSINTEHRLTKLEEKALSYEALKKSLVYAIIAVLGLIVAQVIGITFKFPNFIK